jgi:hypothetical protein
MANTMDNPWTFGLNQLLTVVGFAITIGIAVSGFRSFRRWQREQIEQHRIETAIEALALVYEAKDVFDYLRSPMSFPSEWNDMPASFGTTDQQRSARGPFYAILKRVGAYKEFFDRAWKMQVRCMALFGSEVEQTFLLMQQARRKIEVSAEMLLHNPEPEHKSSDNIETWNSLRADVWPAYAKLSKSGDEVGKMLTEFREQMEALCRPMVQRQYRSDGSWSLWNWLCRRSTQSVRH